MNWSQEQLVKDQKYKRVGQKTLERWQIRTAEWKKDQKFKLFIVVINVKAAEVLLLM